MKRTLEKGAGALHDFRQDIQIHLCIQDTDDIHIFYQLYYF